MTPTISIGPPALFILSLFMKNPTDASKGSNINLPAKVNPSEISVGIIHVDNIAVNTNPGMK